MPAEQIIQGAQLALDRNLNGNELNLIAALSGIGMSEDAIMKAVGVPEGDIPFNLGEAYEGREFVAPSPSRGGFSLGGLTETLSEGGRILGEAAALPVTGTTEALGALARETGEATGFETVARAGEKVQEGAETVRELSGRAGQEVVPAIAITAATAPLGPLAPLAGLALGTETGARETADVLEDLGLEGVAREVREAGEGLTEQEEKQEKRIRESTGQAPIQTVTSSAAPAAPAVPAAPAPGAQLDPARARAAFEALMKSQPKLTPQFDVAAFKRSLEK